MSASIDRLLSVLLVASAITIAGTLVRREFFPSAATGPLDRQSTFESDWRTVLETSTTVGRRDAPVHIIEFTDYECPFCRRFHGTVDTVRARFGDRVSYSVVHFPLPIHANAFPAARVAECAAGQGRMGPITSALFAGQDSLGKRSWLSYAAEAGVSDLKTFDRCLADSASAKSVARGVKLGQERGVRGTPTVMLNGWRYAGVPSDSELVRAVGDLLAGRPPYRQYPVSAVTAK